MVPCNAHRDFCFGDGHFQQFIFHISTFVLLLLLVRFVLTIYLFSSVCWWILDYGWLSYFRCWLLWSCPIDWGINIRHPRLSHGTKYPSSANQWVNYPDCKKKAMVPNVHEEFNFYSQFFEQLVSVGVSKFCKRMPKGKEDLSQISRYFEAYQFYMQRQDSETF